MKQKHNGAIIIIDVFRAFTTAAYVLARSPTHYILTTQSSVIARLIPNYINPLLIGKPEKQASLAYHIPNSPTRTMDVEIRHKTILHRTEAGAKGILQALNKQSKIVLAASFVNAAATVRYIKMHNIDHIDILPMGHEAVTPSLEDDICAHYIHALINGRNMCVQAFIPSIKEEAGRYFFGDDQWQYPREDFVRCLELNQFNFAIQATDQQDYAVLVRCDI
jgi:2-phosphosulfolactate phosphatase